MRFDQQGSCRLSFGWTNAESAAAVRRDLTSELGRLCPATRREAKEKESSTEAESANRAKDVFLATLGHELRTPLSAIVAWTGVLRDKGSDKNDLQEGLAVIDKCTKAQVKIIEDILDVSRIVSGKLRLEICPCELIEGINAVRPAAEARDIALDIQLDPTASRTSCDVVRIQQIVWNLVSNAVKYTPKGGRISVTLASEKSSLTTEVTDNGVGISAEQLPYVFVRFRQADSGTRRKHGGLGLGLSIVKYLVEAHGGTVEAHSAGEGRGATFTVRLPIRAVSWRRVAPLRRWRACPRSIRTCS